MSNDEEPKGPEWPPLPDVFEIPQETLDRWATIDSAQPLLVPFGKHQLDNLMLGLRQNTMAQIALGEALRHVTDQDIPSAQAEFRRHQELIRYSYSNLNWFIQHVMTAANPAEVPNG